MNYDPAGPVGESCDSARIACAIFPSFYLTIRQILRQIYRYVGEVGDIVVGRIAEVGINRWRVDIGARQHGK